ncbi:hypothetical protein [Desulfurobacterium atlanticum]|uniref:Uncharacterized protein n=1 Tax=Desulfurobacterium atlanticum TaxID=240169 RepID=A0A238Z0B5_9BACT|nr:hypothetical protein [Desulfurobacterium atlanticum]SNR76368.1 hypothetical protein SAMN06265340_105124 [Desulfurobacterium atlanticum]
MLKTVLDIAGSNISVGRGKEKANKRGVFDSLFASILDGNLDITNSNVFVGKGREKFNKKGVFDFLFVNILNDKFETKKQLFSGKTAVSSGINFDKKIKEGTGNSIGIKNNVRFIDESKSKKAKLRKAKISYKELIGPAGRSPFFKFNTPVNPKLKIDDIPEKISRKKQQDSASLENKSLNKEFYLSEVNSDLKEDEVLAENSKIFSFVLSKAAKRKDGNFVNFEQSKTEDSFFKIERKAFSVSGGDKSEIKYPDNRGKKIIEDEKRNFKGMKSEIRKKKMDSSFLGIAERNEQVSVGAKFMPVDKGFYSGNDTRKNKLTINVSAETRAKKLEENDYRKIVHSKRYGNVDFVETFGKNTVSNTKTKVKDSQIVISGKEGSEREVFAEDKNLMENLVDKRVVSDKFASFDDSKKTSKKNLIEKAIDKLELEGKKKDIKVVELKTKSLQIESGLEKISSRRPEIRALQNTGIDIQSQELQVYSNMKNNLNEKFKRVQIVGSEKSIESKEKNTEKGIFSADRKGKIKNFSEENYRRKVMKFGADVENRSFRPVEHKFESFITNRLTDRHFDIDRRSLSHETHFTDVSFQRQNFHSVATAGSSSSYSDNGGANYNNHGGSFQGNSSSNPVSERFVLSAQFEDLRVKAKMIKRFINVTIEIPHVTFSFADLKDEIREILRNSNLSGLKVKIKNKGKEIYSETVFSDEVRESSSLELRV